MLFCQNASDAVAGKSSIWFRSREKILLKETIGIDVDANADAAREL